MFPFGDDPSFKRPPFHLYDPIPIPIPNPPNPINISNSNPKHDDAAGINAISPNFFPNFPSPFFDDDNELPLNQIFPKPPVPNPPPILPKKESKHRSAAPPPPRKRTGKKDRHSKICTAQGIRDRRMRLSLQVARKFFDLQDMLGYDKASKTIEWLFIQSKKAIKDLAAESGKSASSAAAASDSVASECEVVSGIEEISSNTNGGGGEAREKREKARARARCRTEEKKKKKSVGGGGGESSPNSEKLGSSRSCGAGDYATVAHAPSDAGTIENLLGSSMGFLGNWDLWSNDHHSRLINNNYAGNSNSIYSPDFPLFHQ